MHFIKKFARKGRLVVAGAIVALTLATVATVGLAPAQANAASCDPVNIIHCGLAGSDLAGNISSFKSMYNANNDNGHNDLAAVYDWSGLSSSEVSGMNTSNTKLGTLYRNGEIKVGGVVVANDAWVSARFTEGSGFVQIKDGVWARKTTTSFANDSVGVLVHFNSDGTFDSAIMTNCGNAVKATRVVKPAPKPSPAPKPAALQCVKLVSATTAKPLNYSFTASATPVTTEAVRYNFNFGDGSSMTSTTSDGTANVTHTFAANSHTYRVTVAISNSTQSNITSDTCATTVTTPGAAAKPALACTSLSFTNVATQPLTVNFVANAAPTKTAITDYVFDFGDGQNDTIASTASSARTSHTYAANQAYTATVTVNSADVKGITSTSCKVNVTLPTSEECMPGVAKGSPQCNVVTTAVQEQPTTLVNTGPGAIVGLFAGTSALGAAGFQVFRRFRR
jgi:hypothetical protein